MHIDETGPAQYTKLGEFHMSRFARRNTHAKPLIAAIAYALASASVASHAQAAEDDADTAQGEVNGSMLEEVVVTGTTGRNVTALETSYGVAVLNEEALQRENAVGFADLMDAVPGLWGEPAGGEVNTNLSARGTRSGFNSYISLQEDGLPVLYSPFFSEYEIRYDATYDRVETILGGPSGIFTAQGAAATVNFISRLPQDRVEADTKIAVTDFGQVRTDVFVGGPIAGSDSWFGSIGGYYRRGQGVRDVGYDGELGGQLRGNLKYVYDSGSVTFAYKHIDDNTIFYINTPVDLRSNKPEALPGFNARDNTLMGPDTRFIDSKTPHGIEHRDLKDGQDSKTDQFSVKYEQNLGENWRLKEHARISDIDRVSSDLRGGSNATVIRATDFISSQSAALLAAFPTATQTQLVRVRDGEVISDPAGLNGNGLLAQQNTIAYASSFDEFINDVQLTYEGDRLLVTAGLQYWDISNSSGERDDTFLVDVRQNANRMDLQAVDASGAVVGHLTDGGVLVYSALDNRGTFDTESINPYLNIELQVTDNLRVDAGVRHESVDYSGTAEDVNFVVPLPAEFNDPSVLADDFALMDGNGTIVTGEQSLDDVAWTIGANYKFTDSFAIYARYAEAFDMGIADFAIFSIPAFGSANMSSGFPQKPTSITFAELGVRYNGEKVAAFATAFHTDNQNVAVLHGATGTDVFPVDNETLGVEFALQWRPIEQISLEFSGVVQDSQMVDDATSGVSFDGNQVDRLPNLQLRLMPTYYFDSGQVYLSAQHYGKRYADLANTQEFPAYTSIDAGVLFDVGEHLSFGVQGSNLTDELAFTTGNPRGNSIFAGIDEFGLAQALPGRVFTAFATYRF